VESRESSAFCATTTPRASAGVPLRFPPAMQPCSQFLLAAVRGNLHGAFAYAKPLGQFSVRRSASGARDAFLEFLKLIEFSRGRLLIAQTGDDLIEQRERPATVEQFVGGEPIGRFKCVALFGGKAVQGD